MSTKAGNISEFRRENNEGFHIVFPSVTVLVILTYSYILTLVGDKAVLRLYLPLPGTRYLVNIYHEIYEGIRLHASVVYSSF